MYDILKKEKLLTIIIIIICAHFGKKIKNRGRSIQDKAKVIESMLNSLLFPFQSFYPRVFRGNWVMEQSRGIFSVIQTPMQLRLAAKVSFPCYFVLENGLM